MKKSLCELLRDYFPRDSEVEDFYWTSIANCVFSSFLAHTAIMLNIVTMHAIRKTSSIPKTLKIYLLSLAVSDVGVGLLVQPYYISLLIKHFQFIVPNCNTYKPFYLVSNSFCSTSFLGVFGSKCRQVLSYSSSSQIPGTCDSQACCCCGDLSMVA